MDEKVDQKRAQFVGCPFRRLMQRQKSKDVSFNSNSRGISSLETSRVDASVVELASTSGIDRGPMWSSAEYVRDDSSLLSLHPWIFRKENCQNDWGRMNIGLDRSRGSLRSRRLRRYSIKPVTSMVNYLRPQVFSEHVEIKEYIFSSPPNSPAPTLRTFFITDENKIISNSSVDSVGMQPENGLHKRVDAVGCAVLSEDLFYKEDDGVSLGVMGAVTGVPPLLESRKLKRKSREAQHRRLDASNPKSSCKVSHLEGSLDGMLLFCLGISIGVISTILLNKIEVEKLNKLLMHTEDLVQDLQEELEMKDSLTVKELANGTHENPKLNHCYPNTEESLGSWECRNPTSHSSAQEKYEYNCPLLHTAGENSQSLSRIEAELEAELERLEQNMKASNMERRMSDISELDPDLIVDVVHGELRVDNLTGEILENLANANSDSTTSTSTTHPYNANYSVSPKKLSLRLHEVIQSRLEERIEELERELLQSQRQLQFMEAERVSSHITFSNSDMGFSSNQESPIVMEPNGALVHPLCLNLSEDALNAYDDAYEEFMQMAEEEKNPASSSDTGKWVEGYKLNLSVRSPTWENILWSWGSNDMLNNDEEVGESEI